MSSPVPRCSLLQGQLILRLLLSNLEWRQETPGLHKFLIAV